MALSSQIQSLLKYPVEVKVVLEATFVTTSESDSQRDLQNRRILAVLSHRDDWNLTEEGTLFVYKYKQPRNGRPEELDTQAVLPIYGEFSIVMSQMRRGTLDLRPTLSSTSILDQPRTGLSLSITPAEGISNEGHPLTFLTHDIQNLRRLVAECKRLKQVVDSEIDANTVINLAQSTTHFAWLKPYIARRSTIASLASLTQDLRQVNQSLMDRLSPASAGLSGDDHADIQLLRDEWIRTKARETSRRGRTRLNLRLGTFNVNGKMPSQDLSAWIQGSTTFSSSLPTLQNMSLGGIVRNPFDWPSRTSKSLLLHEEQEDEKIPLRVDTDGPDDPDIFVLGFQELDLSTEALIYYTSTVREDAWCHAIFAALGEKAIKYEKLASRQLVGMLIVVLVRKSLKGHFGKVKTSTAGLGILGVMGNKGGTAIRLSFTPPIQSPSEKVSTVGSPTPITLTFVNAHLAAFDEMAEKRNSDFHDLSKILSFDNNDVPLQPGSEGESISPGSNVVSIGTEPGLQPSLSIYETDALFWMGDLNYRMDIPDHEIRKTLREDDWENGPKLETLLRFDQLKKAMQRRRAFEGFQEAPITHIPTYRFSPGLATDNMGYDLKRKPAWTDRILYMRGPTCQVHQLSYTCHPQIIMSDHRPVSADFSVDADVYDTEELQDSVRTLFNQVEGLHEHGWGDLKIEDAFLDFEKISYDKPVERKFNVKNMATGPRAYRFVSVQVDSPVHPEWLHIHPMTGVLLPDETIQITVRVYIDNAMALILNQKPRDLSATLILHTFLGKDHFISVSGEYYYTCFANKLSRLTRLRGPIRSMVSPNDLYPENHPINAPREVMRLVNWMMTCTLNTDAMFLSPADEVTMNIIRECLDTGDDFPYSPSTRDPELPLAFATTLLRFLESLAEPIVPVSLHPQCLEMSNRDEAFELLDMFPPASVNVWISITAFLHFICQSSQDTNHAERIGKWGLGSS